MTEAFVPQVRLPLNLWSRQDVTTVGNAIKSVLEASSLANRRLTTWRKNREIVDGDGSCAFVVMDHTCPLSLPISQRVLAITLFGPNALNLLSQAAIRADDLTHRTTHRGMVSGCAGLGPEQTEQLALSILDGMMARFPFVDLLPELGKTRPGKEYESWNGYEELRLTKCCTIRSEQIIS